MPTMYRPGGVKSQFDSIAEGEKQGFYASFQEMARAHKAQNAPEKAPAKKKPAKKKAAKPKVDIATLETEESPDAEVGDSESGVRPDQD